MAGAAVIGLLIDDAFDVSQHQPRVATPAEWQFASRIVSIGCKPERLQLATGPIEYWTDVPMVSQDSQGAREAIRRDVTRLIGELQTAQ